jgi:uncharacterized protein DUF29
MSGLYDRDFLLWTEEQATALRRAKGANLPLDWENLAEEIESLGKSDRRALHSHVRRVLRHLLKLTVSPATAPGRGWRLTIREARKEIAIILRDSPSLRRAVDGIIAEERDLAAELAAADLEEHGELTATAREFLQRARLTADQVLEDWFPEAAA